MKLIRDGLATSPWEFMPEGKKFVRPVHNLEEHLSLLRRKILEEAAELIESRTPMEAACEAADLMEAISAFLRKMGSSMTTARLDQITKFEARGGFEHGTVWDI